MRQKIESILSSRFGPHKIAGFLFLWVALTTYPRYLELFNDSAPISTYSFYFDKIEHPLTPLANVDEATHESKIVFRLTPVLIAKLMGNSSAQNGLGIIQLYLLQSLLLFPFIFILLKLLIRLGDSFFAFLVVAAFASIYTTKAFFWDYIFWFDGIAYFFLLLGMYLRNRTGIFFALQLACWTDERAAIALFSIYLFHLLQENNFVLGNKLKYVPSFWKQNSTVVLLCFITYISLRMGIGSYFHLSTPLGYDAKVGLELVLFQIKYKAIGMFLTFEGLWILYFWVLFLLWRKKHYGLCGLLAVAMLGHTVLAYCVYDISRSLSYAFPLLIISFAFLEKFKSNYNQVFTGLATLSCILIPTQYIIFSVNPIPLTILSGKEMYIVAGNISKLIFGI